MHRQYRSDEIYMLHFILFHSLCSWNLFNYSQSQVNSYNPSSYLTNISKTPEAASLNHQIQSVFVTVNLLNIEHKIQPILLLLVNSCEKIKPIQNLKRLLSLILPHQLQSTKVDLTVTDCRTEDVFIHQPDMLQHRRQ